MSDIIAGDFHYIKRFLPMDAGGKMIVTNTVTRDDILWLKEKECGYSYNFHSESILADLLGQMLLKL